MARTGSHDVEWAPFQEQFDLKGTFPGACLFKTPDGTPFQEQFDLKDTFPGACLFKEPTETQIPLLFVLKHSK